jgi:hypothetical protein
VFVLATLTDAISESQAATRTAIQQIHSSPQSQLQSLSQLQIHDGTVEGGKKEEESKESKEKKFVIEDGVDVTEDGVAIISPTLSRAGRCALHATPYLLLLLRKLVQRDSYLKSPITASMSDIVDELGAFQMHSLLYKTFTSVANALLPAFKLKLLKYLPCELQQEWIGIVGDLLVGLQTPLPPSVLCSTPPGVPSRNTVPSNQIQMQMQSQV